MTPYEKIKKVQEIYKKYIDVYQSIPYGGKLDKEMAIKLGVDEEIVSLLDKTIQYGQIKAKTKAKLTFKEIENLMKTETISPRMILEKEAGQIAFDSLVLKGQAKISNLVLEQLKKDYKVIETLLPKEGLTKSQMKRQLREITKDNKQDWDMVIRTELMNKSQKAFAEEILQGKSIYSKQGEETKVFKRPNPNACPHCKRLYLEKDGRPKVFKLKDLLENGSNVGRKVADWKPVVGVTHPHCQCVLQVLPENCILDEQGQIRVMKHEQSKDQN